jgi:hypothetical protein
MKCPICEADGKEVDISDAKARDAHAKTHDIGMTGENLEMLAQPWPPGTMADAFPGKK